MACLLLFPFGVLSSDRVEPVPKGQVETKSNFKDVPFKRDAEPVAQHFIQTVVISFVLLAMVLGVLYLFRNTLFKNQFAAQHAGRIKLVALKRLSPKLTLFLVSVDEQEYLLVQAGDQVQIEKYTATAAIQSEV